MFVDQARMDLILNGEAHGNFGRELQHNYQWDPGMLRPYIDDHGHKCVKLKRRVWNSQTNKFELRYEKVRTRDLMLNDTWHPAWNATSLRKEEWIQFDEAVVMAAREPLQAWDDLKASSTYGGFNAMGHATVEYEAMDDSGNAIMDMNGLTEGENFGNLFSLRSTPLFITHAGFTLDERTLQISRNKGMPLDTTLAEKASRRIAETIEDVTIGLTTGITYGTVSSGPTAHTGTSTVYGYRNFPSRVIYSGLTTPLGTNPNATLDDINDMIETMQNQFFYGPYILYYSTDWHKWMNGDYGFVNSTGWGLAPTKTLRERILDIPDIKDVRRLNRMTPARMSSTFNLLLVQMTPDVAQAIDGMGVTTVQWQEKGGMQTNFKVMCIQVPRLKYDYNDRCGIMHASP